MSDETKAWEGVGQGRPAVFVGTSAVPVPVGFAGLVLRASCDAPRETLGPWWTITARAAHLLGETPPLVSQAKQQVVELGRRLLGDAHPSRGPLEPHLEVIERLARGRRVALVFDAVEEADEATLDAIEELLQKRGALPVALVLGFRARELSERARRLVALVEAAGGVRVDLGETQAPPFDPRTLPAPVLAVLRAVAILGPTVEVATLADVLGMPALDLLLLLQQAGDLGAPLADRGDGVIALATQTAELLSRGTLPSLRIELHRRAAMLAAAPDEARPAAPEAGSAPSPGSTADPAEEPAPSSSPAQEADVSGAEPAPSVEAAPAEAAAPEVQVGAPGGEAAPPAPTTTEGAPPGAEALASEWAAAAEEARAAEVAAAPEAPAVAAAPPAAVAAAPPRESPARPERAAHHWLESGSPLRAADQLLVAARSAARQGAHRRAEALARRALGILEGLPDSALARQLSVRALVAIGRTRLEGFVPDQGFALDGAIEVLEAALRATREPAMIVEASRLLATAHYEKGDLPSLERALAVLTEASRALLDAGEAVRAATLLNDQAAVTLRMGDPVRAMGLAERSRGVFSKQDPREPGIQRELAETDLLIARIVLSVPARDGKKGDALAAAYDHALAAARTFERLGDALAQARALEVLGRVEIRRGRLDRAIAALQQSLQQQEKLSDLIGLARTLGALSEALTAAGRMEEALGLLGDSIDLNRAKGSAVGVAFNRRAFDALRASLRPELGAAAREVAMRLEDAERELGAIHLAGER